MAQRVVKKKLQGLKTHDHHVLLQQIIPAAIRGFLHLGPRNAIIRLGHTFQRICAKVLDPRELRILKTYVTETLGLLERWFSPSFFDITTHLVVHLVDELELCGPVHARWCYEIERFLYTLKRFVRNRSKPEGSMAVKYMYSKALGFLAEHLVLYPDSSKSWDMDEAARDGGEVLEGCGRPRDLTEEERLAIHEFVLANSAAIDTLYTEYLFEKTAHEAVRAAREAAFEPFSTWLDARVDGMRKEDDAVSHEVLLLSQPPSSEVTKYAAMWAEGNHYRCEDPLLGSIHISYDSGVACIINQRCQSSEHDRHPINANLKYVGVLRNIIRVRYASTKLNILKCSWVKLDLVGHAKVRQDEYGFWLVKLGSFQSEDDKPYIFPHHVSQVR